MATWRLNKKGEDFNEFVDIDSGAIKTVKLASEAQFRYLNKLRTDLGKAPLKHRPASYAASKAIDKLLEKIAQQTSQQKLV